MTGFLLGAIFERQKKFDQAEEEFRKVLDANPRNASTLNYYGYMLADRGIRLEEATDLIKRALADDPSNAAYQDSLGWAYYQAEQARPRRKDCCGRRSSARATIRPS